MTSGTKDGSGMPGRSKMAFDDKIEESNVASPEQRTLKANTAHVHKQASAIPETKLDL